MVRQKINKKQIKGQYFLNEKDVKFFSSGCQLLDLVLGGGWAIGRMSNLVGDNSTGKTLLAIEATANFLREFPQGKIWYHESEAAFDLGYARALGMPSDAITFVRQELKSSNKDSRLVEEWFNYLKGTVVPYCLKNKEHPSLYILDTQDALRSIREQDRKIEDGTYNQEKNLVLNRLYPEFADRLEELNVHLMIISQTRQNIGVSFGRKWRVTGDGALQFYSSQRVQLAEMGKVTKTVRGITNPYSLRIKANCFKNKVGLAYRTCEFPLYFGYGVDSNEASLRWLKEVNGLDDLEIGEGYNYKAIQEELSNDQIDLLAIREINIENPKKYKKSELKDLLCEHWDLHKRGRKKSPGGINEVAKMLREVGDEVLEMKIKERTLQMWNEIETEFMPRRSKYGDIYEKN